MMKYDLGTGAAESWLVAETAFSEDTQGKCEAIFCGGNGYLGQRAAFEETYVGQTRDLLVAGTYNAFDETEVTELPNLPDLTNLELRLDGVRFAMTAGETADYLRVLDLRDGSVTRRLVWTRPDGLRFALCFERFVSMDNVHLLGQRVRLTPLDADTVLVMKSGIDGRVSSSGSQHLHEGTKRIFDNTILRMTSRTISSGVTVCEHSAHRFLLDGETAVPALRPIIDRRSMFIRAELTVKQGQTLTIEKLSAVTTDRDPEWTGDPARAEEAGRELTAKALTQGYDALMQSSRCRWAELWARMDIRVTSERPYDQLAVRFALYHLNIMCRKTDNRVGIAAKGLTGEGYKGHSFWDTEIFILPYFTLTQPEAARKLLEYRHLGLTGARRKAAENGYPGAMYPWEAAWFDDGEVTPEQGGADIVTGKPIPILTGKLEQHVTADIIFGVNQYFAATGDRDFMDRCGYEMIIDTARFWAARVVWDEGRQLYTIPDVIGPDEYKEHVDNNAYTNYMAAYNMQCALDVIAQLEAEGGETAARLDAQLDFAACKAAIGAKLPRLYLPQPDENGIVPQFDGYFDLKHIDLTPYKNAKQVGTIYNDYNQEQICTFQVHKQADTLVLLLLRDDLFPADIKTKNYYYYEARTLHDSSLSKSTHCVLAADLGEDETAYRFFKGCCDIDLGPVMTTSDAGIHAAAMGGIWQSAVYGFGGVRVVGDSLHIAPRLPAAWEALRFPLRWQGQPLRVRADRAGVTVTNEGSEPVTVVLAGRQTDIAPGQEAACTKL